MENEIRYFLRMVKKAMNEKTPQPDADENGDPVIDVFRPTHIVTAVKLPTGAVEIAINTENIEDKTAYDDDMLLKTNADVELKNIMIV